MTSKETLYHQIVKDMATVIAVMNDILNEKELTDRELQRINYCTKVTIQVREKVLIINEIDK